MNILVTGGAGFIGSHFIRHWLHGHPTDKITNLDLLTYAGNRDTVKEFAKRGVKFIKGDICDRAAVVRAMKGSQAVFHFAAETHVDRSIHDAQIFLKTNVIGTQVLLEAAREAKVKRFVFVSTDEVYGSAAKGKFSERSPLQPNSPYAASKAAADLLCRSYFVTHGLPVITTRCGNNYGPWQFPEKVIPLFVTNLLEGRTIPVYGRGANVREWIHVEDHCSGIEYAYGGKPGEVYNIGSAQETSNLELARTLLRLTDMPGRYLQFVKDRPGHDFRYALDSAKLRKLGWKPRYTFEDGLRQTVEWYHRHSDWWKPIKRGSGYSSYIKKQYHWKRG